MNIFLDFLSNSKLINNSKIYYLVNTGFLMSVVYFISKLLKLIFNKFDIKIMGNENLYLNLIFHFTIYIFIFIAFYISITILHKREFLTIISFKKFRLSNFLFGFLIWVFISLLSVLYSVKTNDVNLVKSNFNLDEIITFSLVTIPLFIIQTGAEEFIFRSYILQGFYALKPNWKFALFFSALIFSLLHFGNPEMYKYSKLGMFLNYYALSLLLGFAVLLTNGVEFSWGLHFANNLITSTLINYKGSAIQTKSIFIMEKINPWENLLVISICGILVLGFISLFLNKVKQNV